MPINVHDEGAMINMSGFAATDIMTSNGVIHVIDTVLLPKEDGYSSAKSGCEYSKMAEKAGCPAFSKDKAAAKETTTKVRVYSL